MKDRIALAYEISESRFVIEVAFDYLEWKTNEVAAIARRSYECSHAVTVTEQRPDEVPSNKT